MNEQEKREKVIKELAKVLNDIVDGYITEPDMACNTISEALAMLKAEEPSVLSIYAPETDWKDVILWLEIKGEKTIFPCMHREVKSQLLFGCWEALITFDVLGSSKVHGHMAKNYERTWRCWTSRPTDEQREARQWK